MNLVKKSLLIVTMITIIGVGSFFVWNMLNAPNETSANADNIPVEKLLEKSIDTETITTNLADGGYIKTKFKIVTSSKDTAQEMDKLKFRVESTIIKSLNSMKKEDVTGLEGFTFIEEHLKEELNKEFDSNKYITQVYTVDLLVQ